MFEFICGICDTQINNGKKFSVDSTEWESESVGGYGGIDEEAICKKCNGEIMLKIASMKNN